jgi:hypothetical protein
MDTGSESGPASGRFVLRIDPRLHAELRKAARVEGISLNEHCARKLALPAARGFEPGAEATAKAVQLLGDALLGVVAFGSWARGELSERSDIDLLVIVDEKVKIGRGLYRAWDERPVLWNGHSVEPHFVHLPEAGAPLSGTWAEVAVEGIVLYDPDMLVSQTLVRVRQKIASGQIVRRRLHGQSYWVEAA